jgi:hypothetical protein
VSGVVILGFGPQPLDFFKHATKVCGKDAVVAPDVARMAGANLAAGSPEALDALRSQLVAGALQAQQAATPGLSPEATRWLACGQRGTSSNTMFSTLTGVNALHRDHSDHPHDPDDFDRCLRLLADVPELRARLPLMAAASPVWAALVTNWDAIEQSHLSEVGLGWTKAKSAPKTYALMRQVIEAARTA